MSGWETCPVCGTWERKRTLKLHMNSSHGKTSPNYTVEENGSLPPARSKDYPQTTSNTNLKKVINNTKLNNRKRANTKEPANLSLKFKITTPAQHLKMSQASTTPSKNTKAYVSTPSTSANETSEEDPTVCKHPHMQHPLNLIKKKSNNTNIPKPISDITPDNTKPSADNTATSTTPTPMETITEALTKDTSPSRSNSSVSISSSDSDSSTSSASTTYLTRSVASLGLQKPRHAFNGKVLCHHV